MVGNVQGEPEVRAAIAQFLITCCQYEPPDKTAAMGVEKTTQELFDRAGDLATMVAQMKADDASSQGSSPAQDSLGRGLYCSSNITSSK